MGRGCVVLMIHVVDHGRALPVAWLVGEGKADHFPEAMHIALVKQVQALIPLGATALFLGMIHHLVGGAAAGNVEQGCVLLLLMVLLLLIIRLTHFQQTP
jgi:hypothetical protein